jgi:hypothetical protein
VDVTLRFGTKETTYRGIKDICVYPDGDTISKCFVSMEYITGKADAKRYVSIYTKPTAIITKE